MPSNSILSKYGENIDPCFTVLMMTTRKRRAKGDITMKSVSGNSGKSLFIQKTSYGGSPKRGKKKMSFKKLHIKVKFKKNYFLSFLIIADMRGEPLA